MARVRLFSMQRQTFVELAKAQNVSQGREKLLVELVEVQECKL